MNAALLNLTQRLDRLPGSRIHTKMLVIAALSLFFDTLDTVVTGFVLADLRGRWDFGPREIGIVSAIGLFGYLIGSAAAGFAADHLGRKKTILYTLLLYSAFSASRGFSDNLIVFAILNFFTWVFVGAESSTVPAYLIELWPSRIRGKLNGWMMGFFALGLAASPIWALYLIPTLGWQWALFLTAPFAALGGLMRSALPESPRWLVAQGRTDEADRVVTGIERAIERERNITLPPVALQEPAPGPRTIEKQSAWTLVSRPYLRVTIMLWIAWFAQYGVLYTFMTVLPTILALEGYPVVKSFQFSVFIFSAFVPAYVFGGYVVEWLDRKYAAAVSYVSIALFGTLFGFATDTTMMIVFGGLTAFSLGIGATFIYTYTPELYPTEIRATGMGICSAWGRVGAILLLLAFGVFAVLQGKLVLFLVSDVMLLCAFTAVLVFGPSTKGKSLEASSIAPTQEVTQSAVAPVRIV
ncbi:MFS transporter [Methylobacterium planeticum]|uniref:MFS transporter n=1 Tax=Methylobacterium planeticum TaxID=2615211 RepID=A0A6N6MQV0_9HYPH|nr:MFS transporter [Methylobacterium planeticum]KAB1071661.1 MFS transporter [Methylobacterium planeticum]